MRLEVTLVPPPEKNYVSRCRRDDESIFAREQLTWVHPLHAIGECVVLDEVVSSPAGIGNDNVSRGDGGQDDGEE